MKRKTVKARLEQEIQYSPDKEGLMGCLYIGGVEIYFTILLSLESTETYPILREYHERLFSIRKQRNSEDVDLQEFESRIFYNFLIRLVKKFFNDRAIFRSVHREKKSMGSSLVRYGGITELDIQLCEILNRYFNANINIPQAS